MMKFFVLLLWILDHTFIVPATLFLPCCRKLNTKDMVGLGSHQQDSKAFTVQLLGESYQDLQLSPGFWKVAHGTWQLLGACIFLNKVKTSLFQVCGQLCPWFINWYHAQQVTMVYFLKSKDVGILRIFCEEEEWAVQWPAVHLFYNFLWNIISASICLLPLDLAGLLT
jgi:hypothetical protein